MSYIIGIDIGTTNTKAVAFTDMGRVLADANSSYAAFTGEEGMHELDPRALWDAVLKVLSEVLSRTGGQAGLAGVSFSCAMHSLIAVDQQGELLTRAMTWADSRSRSFADKLKASEAGRLIYRQTGTPIHAMSPLCKLLWLREKEPDVFRRATRFISIKEYIWWKLFGKYQVDHSLASATGLFDIYRFTWYRESLELAGIREDQLSEPVACTHKETGHRLEGLPKGLPFIIGGSDGCLANLGSGVVKPGETALTIGTSGAIRMTAQSPAYDAQERIFRYILTPDLYVCGGATNNGGGAVQWFATNLGGGRPVEELVRGAFEVAGSDGLIFLPYLLGERAPVWNADARGVFFGIKASHGRAHFMRAVLEGIGFSLRQVGVSLEETIGPIKHIYASGGFTHSPLWLQMMAEIFGRTVYTTGSADASAIGACIMGAYALGIIPGLEEAATLIKIKDSYEPRRQDIYGPSYAIYTELYGRLKDLM
ncbi:MAG TPA: gluconokinase [Puia sp.]|uniref:gluconokinase n=1 Tax=Puia sp. TaxID=2045100 RepID=UPI002C4F351C|nr:gluconokinase [Puia sp.]HVU95921.1 gluconokinase [Puia sp.]